MYFLEANKVFLVAQLDVNQRTSCGQPFSRSLFDLQAFDPTNGTARTANALADPDNLVLENPAMWFQDLPNRLQSVRVASNAVWMAFPGENTTTIGQFDLRRFHWLNVDYVPNLQVHAKDIWVDEDNQKLYFVYKGHLLRLPLPASWFEVKNSLE